MTVNAIHTLKAERAILHSNLMHWEDLRQRLNAAIVGEQRKEAALTEAIERLMQAQHVAPSEFGRNGAMQDLGR